MRFQSLISIASILGLVRSSALVEEEAVRSLDPAIREKLEQGFHLISRITSFSREQLEVRQDGSNIGLFSYYHEHPSESVNDYGFWQLSDPSIRSPVFNAAWGELATRAYPDRAPPAVERCKDLITSFFVHRPHWYMPSRAELSQLRLCLDFGAGLIRAVDGTNAASVPALNLVGSVVADLIVPAYTHAAELFSRYNETLLNRPEVAAARSDFQFFQQFIRSSPVIKGLLDAAVESADASQLRLIRWADTRMAFEILVHPDSDKNIHAGDFIDNAWAHAEPEGQGAATLQLWQALAESITDFDARELQFEANKPGVVHSARSEYADRITHQRFGMGMGRSGWMTTVGGFFNSLRGQEAMEACLVAAGMTDPSENVYYLFEGSAARTISLYNCIVNGVEAGEIVLHDSPHKNANVAVLMHLVRMTHSALPFLVQATATAA
jgi:hypothetical protein